MNRVEERLTRVLRESASHAGPAPDLFARVRRSVEDDRRRRAQRRRAIAVLGCLVGAIVAIVVGVADLNQGAVLMDWWILELLTTAVLIGIAAWLGPFIRRFGRSYAADVFRANPRTGKSFIVLADIAYYLIFTAYVLFTVRFEPQDSWGNLVTARQLQYDDGTHRRHPAHHRHPAQREPADPPRDRAPVHAEPPSGRGDPPPAGPAAMIALMIAAVVAWRRSRSVQPC